MQPRRNRKRRYAASIGGAFILLAVIGVATVVVISLRMTMNVLDNSGEKERFAEMIRPVMMFDPVPFEKPEDIEMTNLLLYSMWSALLSERAASYTYNESQELMVPASDLDVAAASIFGNELVLEHQGFTDYDASAYIYYPKTNTYGVRVTAQLYVYSPQVQEITKEGELYCLEVRYLPPEDAWTMSPAGRQSSPYTEKRMLYYMAKNRSGYQLVKVADPPSAVPVS